MSVMTIKLSKAEGTPWGFRLQGGKDFATPLCIQKVNGGSVAASAGLQAGDAIVSIGGKDALSLRHKEAQEAIVRAGNSFDLVVQRGAPTWKPAVTPLAQVKTTPEGVPVATSTSLAANKQPVRYIGSNHNSVARPFPGFTGSQPAYTHTTTSLKNTLHEASEGSPGTPISGTSSRSTSGSTSPSSCLPVAGTTISLNKENAKNFLKMTLDKENVNTINVHTTAYKNQKSNSNENIFTSQFLNNNGAVGGSGGHQRKYSLASNTSSCSSDADHDSLTRRNNEYVAPVGSSHNTVAVPFAEVNGQQIVNTQYNTPLKLYSDDNIAETLYAQAEVLGKGCLGINFKKYARETVIQTESPTYKLIHGDGEEAQKKARPPPISPFDKEAPPPAPLFSRQKPASKPAPAAPAPPQQGGQSDSPLSGGGPSPTGIRSVRAPQTKVKPEGVPDASLSTKCSECERPIIGVFVRIKNKNLHADCFKCSTCGSSLKNVGYYNINEKLYCDVHAKQAARHNPPGPNLEPIIVKPGAPVPAGAMPACLAKVAPAPAPFKPPVGGVRIMPTSSVLAPGPMPKFAPVPPPKPAPAPVPAPIFAQAPAAPMAAPPPTFTPFKAQAAPAHHKVPFGAPAGSVDVRSHIPKKGAPFVWPPPKKVDAVEEGPRSPAWAPAGEPVYVPRPKHAAGPPPKRPPLLPTPPPPKDYDTMVIKASPPTQQPAKPAKTLPASASAPVVAPTPAPNPVVTPACTVPSSPGKGKIDPPAFTPIAEPMPSATKCAPTPKLSSTVPASPKPVAAKPAAAKPAASKPVSGFKSVAAPKPNPSQSSNVGFKPVAASGKKTGLAPGAPSRLASAPIPPPVSVPIVNSIPAPAPKPAPGPAAASASAPMPKPAAPKPPAPTGPAPVFAPAPAPAPVSSLGGMPKPTPIPDLGGSSLKGVAQTGGQRTAPRRGRGVMNPSTTARIPICADCTRQIRGPFVSALGKTWCPDHFVCSTVSCRRALIDMGFVEEQGSLHCEDCYEKYFAPICGKCDKRVKGDCLNAVGKQFHPECFCCAYCGKVFGSGAFYLEDGLPYCEADWNDLFTTKCVGCGFPIEAGDRWVEALNNNYHSQCFKCSKCHKNLEGQSFFAKGGKPFCKAHAQRGF
ncbi:LIM domain-binding protein 3 isoform X27 [Procambarus clarkii]|uniref:LIM domain-binding protein 3 isoform X27 n=1 Tax=Procambarus clarkii TaxID=6728 RepID=UPI003743C6A8